jgi:RsiW-degrading membrane proteinase PrsW (M82 family)
LVPVSKALEASGQFLRYAAPQRKPDAPKTTARDVSTVGISTSIVVVVVWLIYDVAELPIPLEVAVSLANIGGFFLARKFRY